MQATVIIMISWELGSLRVGDYRKKYIFDNLTYYFLFFFVSLFSNGCLFKF